MRMWMAALTLAVPAAASAQTGERIAAAAGGISIELPKGWTVLSADPAVEALRGKAHDSAEFRRTVTTTGVRFLTLTKYSGGRGDAVPTIGVDYRSLDDAMLGMGPVEVLKWLTRPGRHGFRDAEVLDPPTLMQFAGAPGAHVRIAHTLRHVSGVSYPAISEVWLSLRGTYAISLQASYAPDEPAGGVIEIDNAVRSFRVDDSGPPPHFFPPN